MWAEADGRMFSYFDNHSSVSIKGLSFWMYDDDVDDWLRRTKMPSEVQDIKILSSCVSFICWFTGCVPCVEPCV